MRRARRARKVSSGKKTEKTAREPDLRQYSERARIEREMTRGCFSILVKALFRRQLERRRLSCNQSRRT